MRVLLFLFLLLTGCATFPKWYLNPPKDNNSFLYASAMGESKKEAINKALSFLASKLKIDISSNTQIEKSLSTTNSSSSFYKNFSQNIKTQIKNIVFYDYKIEKLKNMDNKFFVLIKINRIKNAQLLYKFVNKKIDSITIPKNLSPLQKLKLFPTIKRKLKKLSSQIETINLLDPNLDTSYLLKKIDKLLKKLNSDFSFKVKGFLKNYIEDLISQKYNLSPKGDITITSIAKLKTSKIMDYKIAKYSVILKISDSKIQKTYQLNCSAKSFDKNLSIELAIKKCKEKIKKLLKSAL